MAKTRVILWFCQLSPLTLRPLIVKPSGDLTWATQLRVQTVGQIYAGLISAVLQVLCSVYITRLQIHLRTVLRVPLRTILKTSVSGIFQVHTYASLC